MRHRKLIPFHSSPNISKFGAAERNSEDTKKSSTTSCKASLSATEARVNVLTHVGVETEEGKIGVLHVEIWGSKRRIRIRVQKVTKVAQRHATLGG